MYCWAKKIFNLLFNITELQFLSQGFHFHLFRNHFFRKLKTSFPKYCLQENIKYNYIIYCDEPKIKFLAESDWRNSTLILSVPHSAMYKILSDLGVWYWKIRLTYILYKNRYLSCLRGHSVIFFSWSWKNIWSTTYPPFIWKLFLAPVGVFNHILNYL